MTSEVMLLNVQGGALAADSALTAIEYHKDGTASVRYQTGADKIFVLDSSLPVASMIFDVAEFYRYQWGAIFDTFKTVVPQRGNTVAKVTQSLIQFLGRWTSGADSKAQELLPLEDGQERLSFAIYIAALVQRFHQCVELASGQKQQAIPRALDMLRKPIEASPAYHSFGALAFDRSGRLLGAQDDLYGRALDSILLPRLLVGLQQAMQSPQRKPQEEQGDAKAYLMLGGQSSMDQTFARATLRSLFDRLLPGADRQSALLELLGRTP